MGVHPVNNMAAIKKMCFICITFYDLLIFKSEFSRKSKGLARHLWNLLEASLGGCQSNWLYNYLINMCFANSIFLGAPKISP